MVAGRAGIDNGSSRDCWDEGTTNSSEDGVVGTLASVSMGIVRGSSRDCCDEGTMHSSGDEVVEDVMEISASFSADVTSGSWYDEGSTSSYPDSLSDRITSGAPSIESRRVLVEVVVLALPRSL